VDNDPTFPKFLKSTNNASRKQLLDREVSRSRWFAGENVNALHDKCTSRDNLLEKIN
jgi:hypothetical protein